MLGWFSAEAERASCSKRARRSAVARELCGQDLEGHVAAQARVARAVDLAHASGAERPQDLVDAEARAGRDGHGIARAILCGKLPLPMTLPPAETNRPRLTPGFVGIIVFKFAELVAFLLVGGAALRLARLPDGSGSLEVARLFGIDEHKEIVRLVAAGLTALTRLQIEAIGAAAILIALVFGMEGTLLALRVWWAPYFTIALTALLTLRSSRGRQTPGERAALPASRGQRRDPLLPLAAARRVQEAGAALTGQVCAERGQVFILLISDRIPRSTARNSGSPRLKRSADAMISQAEVAETSRMAPSSERRASVSCLAMYATTSRNGVRRCFRISAASTLRTLEAARTTSVREGRTGRRCSRGISILTVEAATLSRIRRRNSSLPRKS